MGKIVDFTNIESDYYNVQLDVDQQDWTAAFKDMTSLTSDFAGYSENNPVFAYRFKTVGCSYIFLSLFGEGRVGFVINKNNR